MTDRDFVNILRHCDTLDCQNCPYCTECLQVDMSSDAVADRVERLLNENDLLYREVAKLKAECDHFRDLTKKLWCEKRYGEDTNVPTKWHLGTEYPPMEKIEDPEDEWWESDRAVVVTSKGVLTVATAWELNGEFGWTDEVEQKDVAVKMWMQLEPPSTEGVE